MAEKELPTPEEMQEMAENGRHKQSGRYRAGADTNRTATGRTDCRLYQAD